MNNISENIRFADICAMLEKVKKAKNQAAKEKIIRRYYDSFQKFRATYLAEKNVLPDSAEDGNSSFYCVLRCLIPNEDSARKPYRLQISALGRVYIKVLQLSKDSDEVRRLQARSFSHINGDYADIVYSVLLPRCTQESSNLTLHEVHQMLDSIADDDIKSTEKVLTRLAEIASAQEQIWFIRLLLKSMHLGIGSQRIFAILHTKAIDVHRRCSNLARVCCILADDKIMSSEGAEMTGVAPPADGLNLNEVVTPFQHIRPMLCEVFQGNVTDLMESDVLYLETKMDGERFQLHYADERFKYISRNGVDYTHSYGENYTSGTLTPELQSLLPADMQSIILDGEMMIYDTYYKCFRDKGENTDVKHLSGHTTWRPCFIVYDVLYFNGKSMLEMPYAQRCHKITELVKEKPSVLQIIKPIKITSAEEFQRLFQAALDSNEEGVVVKKQNSIYRPGVRNGGGWYKIKADYIEGLTTEFDLLIIGGFYNRSRTFMHSFLLGVLKYTTNTQYEVYSVGNVRNNKRDRVALNNALKPYWYHMSREPPPAWYHYKESNADGCPDVWIEPKNSAILQIKAADLTPTSAFVLAKSLHFPRIELWRKDKMWNECLTLHDFMQMCQGKRGIKKIHKRNVNMDDLTTIHKRRKLTDAQRRKLGMLTYEQRFNPKEVEQRSNLFDGFSFCILSASLKNGYTPEDLKALVVSNGGQVVENPIQDPKCISVAGDITFRVETLKKSRRYNIASLEWLVKICESQELRLGPRDMVCLTDELKEELTELYDKYGDSYTDDISVQDLQKLLDDIPIEEFADVELSTAEQAELEEIIYDDAAEFFRKSKAYFYNTEQRSEFAQILFKWLGGVCIDAENELQLQTIDYVFINSKVIEKDKFNAWLLQHLLQHLSKICVVNIDWIIHSHRAKRKLDVYEYTWHEF